LKKDFNFLMVVVLIFIFVSGCSHLTLNEVIHDEILTYETSFNQTYLDVVDIGEALEGWTLETTSYTEGLIAFRQKGANGSSAVIIIKTLDKRLTSIELAKASQSVRGVGKFLIEIDKMFLAKQKAREKEEQKLAEEKQAAMKG